MKSAFAALATVLILPAAALAAPQSTTPAPRPTPATPAPAPTGAAASLPNTFDGPPAQSAPRPTPRPAAQAAPAAPAGPAVSAQSDSAKVAAAELILKKTIAAMQAGTPNYGDMTTDLAEKVRAQAGNMLPLFTQLGALQSVTHVTTQDGAELFDVIFANTPTQWIIAQNAQGKIVALLFRPAPAPGA